MQIEKKDESLEEKEGSIEVEEGLSGEQEEEKLEDTLPEFNYYALNPII